MGNETATFMSWSNQKSWQLLEGRVLGSGAFAKVFLAIHNHTGRQAAIKVMDKQTAGNRPDVLAGEVHVLKYLAQHLNDTSGFSQLLDAYEDSKCVYIVLELCRGQLVSDLQQELRLPPSTSSSAPAAYPCYVPMPEAHAAWIIGQMASALRQLHSVGVIHRDIKPQNVMFGSMLSEDQMPQLKLIDFGMASLPQAARPLHQPFNCTVHKGEMGSVSSNGDARSGGSDAEVSVITEIMGSEPFVAPEVLRTQRYSPAVDMWSLGVTAYLLLSGRHPFHSDEAVLARPVPRFSEAAWCTISTEGCNVVRGLLQQQPRNRMRADQLCAHPWLRMASRPLTAASSSDCVDGVRACSNGQLSSRVLSHAREDETQQHAGGDDDVGGCEQTQHPSRSNQLEHGEDQQEPNRSSCAWTRCCGTAPDETWRQQQHYVDEMGLHDQETGADKRVPGNQQKAWEEDGQCRVMTAQPWNWCSTSELSAVAPDAGDFAVSCVIHQRSDDLGLEAPEVKQGCVGGEGHAGAGADEDRAAAGVSRCSSNDEGRDRSGGSLPGREEGPECPVGGRNSPDCGALGVLSGREATLVKGGQGWRHRRWTEGDSSCCSSGSSQGEGDDSSSSSHEGSTWQWRRRQAADEALRAPGGGCRRWLPPVAAPLSPRTVPQLQQGRRHTLLLVPHLPASWESNPPPAPKSQNCGK